MGKQRITASGNVTRWWVTHLLLLAYIARALIPAGYMPDFAAASDGIFKVVICSAMGAKSIALDEGDAPLPGPSDGHDDQPCAFAGLVAVAMPALGAFTMATPEFQVSNLYPRVADLLPPARAGPQLGSRGPPQVL